MALPKFFGFGNLPTQTGERLIAEPLQNPNSTVYPNMAALLDRDGSQRAKVITEQANVVIIITLKRPSRSAKYPGTIRPK